MIDLRLSRKKVFIASIAILLAIVLAVSLAIYFVSINTDKTSIAVDGNGNELIGGKVHEMPQNLIFTSNVEETADNSGITLKATVKPTTALDKSLIWSVAWQDPSETFASNNDITAFVTVTEKSSDTAEIKCLKPFGSRAAIKVMSTKNINATATCVVDYMSKLKEFNFNIETKQNLPNTSSRYIYSIPVYSSDTDNYVIPFIPFSVSSKSDILTSFSTSTDTWSSKEIYTLKDEIDKWTVEFSLTPLVKDFYSSNLIYTGSGRTSEYSNTKPSSEVYYNEGILLSYTLLFCSADIIVNDVSTYNSIVEFLGSHVDDYLMSCKYKIATINGVVFEGISNYKYTPESVGLVAESIEIDSGNIKF